VNDADAGFRRGSIGASGVVGQSLSAMGLSGVIGTSVPVIAILAGAGGWLTWVIAAAVMMLVALSIALLSRRYATTGGLYGLAAKALGPLGALVTGWLMVALIGFAAGTAILSFGIYFANFLSVFHVHYGRPILLGVSLPALVACWWLARVGARPAAWFMFVAEVAATIAILAVFVVVLFQHRGSLIDPVQLKLQHTSLAVIVTAVVLGVGGFGGFESATIYGQEARRPTRVIPAAMVACVAIGGVVWMFSSYTLFLGFQDSGVSLAKSAAPLGTLAQIAGIGWYGYIIDLALSVTIGASIIAVFSWVARMMFTMSREGVGPSAWRTVHPKYKTPATALTFAGVIWFVAVLLMGLGSSTPLATYGATIGDLSGYPLLLVYALICIAACLHQWKQGKRRSPFILVGLLGAAAMAYVMERSLFPWPPLPESIAAGLFVAATVVIVLVYAVLHKRDRKTFQALGASVDEDTAEVLAATADRQPFRELTASRS
jgi:amino acid transporter